MAAPMPRVPPVTRATRPLTVPVPSCCGNCVAVIVGSFRPGACPRALLTMWLISFCAACGPAQHFGVVGDGEADDRTATSCCRSWPD